MHHKTIIKEVKQHSIGFSALSAKEILSAIPLVNETKRLLQPMGLFIALLMIYLFLGYQTLVINVVWLNFIYSIALTSVLASMFVMGHDACHQSLTAYRWLNQILGRLCFLPGLHIYRAWEYMHNGLHHGNTNIKGFDTGFCPLSKEEYDNLPVYRQLLQNFYRSPAGMFLYYPITNWVNEHVFPSGKHSKKLNAQVVFQLDRVLMFSFFALQVFLCIKFSISVQDTLYKLLFLILIPQLLWGWLMTFVTFLQHTHPRVMWFKNHQDWTYFDGQVRNTVHVVFPRLFAESLLHITSHTAHHVNTKVAFYHLREAQQALESRFNNEIIIQPFSFKFFLYTLSVCRLYDYENHCWMDWNGNPTTLPRIAPMRLLAA